MEARAVQRHIGIPATKVRQVIDLIRGKSVEEALAILQFTPRFSARIIEKTLRSAIANAVNRDDEVTTDADELFVSRIFADEGRTLKRLRPRARGSANRINKRQSHVTIIVSDGRAEVVRTDEASATEAVVDTAE
ncbi:MAG: 50S ribosomal protein L22 [Gemmatimonadetes bacterium]|jgi:large subunit ribosomal protein L22|nr:50S ribosomal protein L22 [Gemmatimonadota bacterium]MBT7351793.1 50S ribosomal protein L22 [Phycisphaerae bacterium]MBT4609594.1 50S ribosomal protein L22 [Gemmatimonadota bacterium]MBT5055658.1 50S ribosomal protein L22 [Gemmatimonadota bacterium]MBT5143821.1 50S ribosomal protein L22 [Gemmatimonadota bacterium]